MVIVSAAARKNIILENVTEARIGEITRNWFKYARDRDGEGKDERLPPNLERRFGHVFLR